MKLQATLAQKENEITNLQELRSRDENQLKELQAKVEVQLEEKELINL